MTPISRPDWHLLFPTSPRGERSPRVSLSADQFAAYVLCSLLLGAGLMVGLWLLLRGCH